MLHLFNVSYRIAQDYSLCHNHIASIHFAIQVYISISNCRK